MRLASSITPVLAGISTLYSTTNNIIVSSFTPSSSSNNVVSSRRPINNKLYSSNIKNENHDGSHQLLTVHELDTIISSTATADNTQSTQQNVVDNKKMSRRQLLKQCTISSLLGIVQLSSCCNEVRYFDVYLQLLGTYILNILITYICCLYCALLLYAAIIKIIRHGPRLKHLKIQMSMHQLYPWRLLLK